ncbi:hypothetical protein RCJ22_15595 [Vibrio sp. FNV 38]|nr:hypothetical protein [Vibrio sp. FNV 38]
MEKELSPFVAGVLRNELNRLELNQMNLLFKGASSENYSIETMAELLLKLSKEAQVNIAKLEPVTVKITKAMFTTKVKYNTGGAYDAVEWKPEALKALKEKMTEVQLWWYWRDDNDVLLSKYVRGGCKAFDLPLRDKENNPIMPPEHTEWTAYQDRRLLAKTQGCVVDRFVLPM